MLSVEPSLWFSASSSTICLTSATDLTGTYPTAFRPRILGPSAIPRTRAASSYWLNRADAADRLALASLLSRPWTVCAAAMRALPSLVFGPEPRPPWNWHFWVRLALSAGRPHCCLVRELSAVQRRHRIRPLAVRSCLWIMFNHFTRRCPWFDHFF